MLAPEHAAASIDRLRAGRERSGRPWRGFDLVPTVPVILGPDVEACADAIRGYVALYVGGMGSAKQNFYNRLVSSIGFEETARRVQVAYLDGRPRDAAALLPLELLDAVALLGPAERVAERVHRYADVGVTTLSITPFDHTPTERLATLRTLAELVGPASPQGSA